MFPNDIVLLHPELNLTRKEWLKFEIKYAFNYIRFSSDSGEIKSNEAIYMYPIVINCVTY